MIENQEKLKYVGHKKIIHYLPHNSQLGVQHSQTTWWKTWSTGDKLTKSTLLIWCEFAHNLKQLK